MDTLIVETHNAVKHMVNVMKTLQNPEQDTLDSVFVTGIMLGLKISKKYDINIEDPEIMETFAECIGELMGHSKDKMQHIRGSIIKVEKE